MRVRPREVVGAAWLLSVFLLATGCTAAENGADSTGISIEPAEATLLVGDTLRLELKARGREGSAVWSSEDNEIATVFEEGVVEGRAQGETLIQARLGDTFASAKVRVETPLDVEIELHRADNGYDYQLGNYVEFFEIGQGFEVEAAAHSRDGRSILTDSFDWTVSDPAVVEVGDAWGISDREIVAMKAIGRGEAVIRASFAAWSSEFEVVVTPEIWRVEIEVPSEMVAGETYGLFGEALDKEGRSIPERRLMWISSDPSIVALEGDEAIALEPGEVSITGTLWGRGRGGSASQTVVVHPRP